MIVGEFQWFPPKLSWTQLMMPFLLNFRYCGKLDSFAKAWGRVVANPCIVGAGLMRSAFCVQ